MTRNGEACWAGEKARGELVRYLSRSFPRFTKDEHEDIVMDALLAVWNNPDQRSLPDTNLLSLLKVVTWREANRRWRRQQHLACAITLEQLPEIPVEADQDLWADLRRARTRLQARLSATGHRRASDLALAVWAHLAEGMTIQAAATRHRLSRRAVGEVCRKVAAGLLSDAEASGQGPGRVIGAERRQVVRSTT